MCFHRSLLLLGWLLAAACSEPHGVKGDVSVPKPSSGVAVERANMTNQAVLITVSGPRAPVDRRGPIPAVVAIRNASTGPVELLLPYPNPNHLRFESTSATRKEVEHQEVERTVPVSIAPGNTFISTYFLNRYLAFGAPGIARVIYHLDVYTTLNAGSPAASGGEIVSEGDFTVELIEGTEEALKGELSNHAVGLRSGDRRIKMEAAEALAFLDTPLALEYQARMLTIDNLEVIGIQALGRSSSPRAHQLIVGMLSHPDSMVVAAALAEIDSRRIALPREKVHALLSSDNPNIRWTAVDWMAAHPDTRDRAVVSPLLGDPNAEVRSRAKEYLTSLPE